MNLVEAFDQEATATMTEAYEKACQSMHDWGQPDIRPIVAIVSLTLATWDFVSFTTQIDVGSARWTFEPLIFGDCG